MTTWSTQTKTLPGEFYLLMETGDYLLLETGDRIILDQSFTWSNSTKETVPTYTNITKN
jgi:hypothetical protein